MNEQDEGVSPVIGVILMVAITVILAAIIAAFTFGLTGDVSKLHTVGATARVENGNQIVVTYQGGPDHNQLSQSDPVVAMLNNEVFTQSFNAPTEVGETVIATHTAAETDHVIVVATFNDGSQKVILDMYL